VLTARGCSPAAGMLVLARQGVLASCWPLARGAAEGARRAGRACSLDAPRAGSGLTLLAHPRAGAYPAQCLYRHTGELHAPLTSTLASSSATTSLQSSNLQGDIVLKAHVTSVCFKCFRCFIWMSHVSHLDIAKVDRDVAIAIHVCCNCMFQMFPLFFQTYVASAFVWMLHMFHTYVASVLSGYCICFVIAFHVFLQVLLTL
jgi:hypothetical protein